MKGDEKFQSFVHEELANLRNSVSIERQTRERDDGEIVDALVSICIAVLCVFLLFRHTFDLPPLPARGQVRCLQGSTRLSRGTYVRTCFQAFIWSALLRTADSVKQFLAHALARLHCNTMV